LPKQFCPGSGNDRPEARLRGKPHGVGTPLPHRVYARKLKSNSVWPFRFFWTRLLTLFAVGSGIIGRLVVVLE
jgi:hypothetical protein